MKVSLTRYGINPEPRTRRARPGSYAASRALRSNRNTPPLPVLSITSETFMQYDLLPDGEAEAEVEVRVRADHRRHGAGDVSERAPVDVAHLHRRATRRGLRARRCRGSACPSPSRPTPLKEAQAEARCVYRFSSCRTGPSPLSGGTVEPRPVVLDDDLHEVAVGKKRHGNRHDRRARRESSSRSGQVCGEKGHAREHLLPSSPRRARRSSSNGDLLFSGGDPHSAG